MKAAVYRAFAAPLAIEQVPDPAPPDGGVVIRVAATGLCRSDWHGWMGHDASIQLPHVPGHEMAGVIEATGKDVRRWKAGDRVTMPFVCACGACAQCASGNQQVCDYQFQPGFTHWGSFAEYAAIDYADVNLARIPEAMNFITAASLGCRFITAFRAVIDQGGVTAGQWVAVHGCGGVGLSAIMIAQAAGARVAAVDINDEKLAFAKSLGAEALVNAARAGSAVEAIQHITRGGAHVSIDALGSAATCENSIRSLRKRGKHIQVGLMLGEHSRAQLPMAEVIANELEILGSHGMPAHRYADIFRMVAAEKLQPHLLIGKTISLEESLTALTDMNSFSNTGVTVIDKF